MRYSEDYASVICSVYDFAANRLIDRVEGCLTVARLYHNAFRALDVYVPAVRIVEDQLAKPLSDRDRRAFETAIKGLNILNDARYHPCYRDHRIFPLLRQYHEAVNLVSENIESLSNVGEEVTFLYESFSEAVENVMSGNGLYVVNWKRPPRLGCTFYPVVELEIGRLTAGEQVGIYTVKVKAGGRVPHHSHGDLEEIHFLPNLIRGDHQLGITAAEATQPDAVYIPKGEVHAFRNKEETDRTFLFICGCEKTGPWDFVQDIDNYPGMDFPSNVAENVEEIGGAKLESFMDTLLVEEDGEPVTVKRLSPGKMRLTHSLVIVNEAYQLTNLERDLLFFVAYGEGYLKIEERQASLREGAVFTMLPEIEYEIEADRRIILHKFEWI